ncbi:MAG: hypothetical protein ACTHW4_11395 [Actinomycetales bacterium]
MNDTPAAPGETGEDSLRRRRRGLVLMLLSPVVLVVGLFGVLMHAVLNGFTGAPPDLIGSDPVAVDDDGTIVLDGDSPYVLVNDRRAAATESDEEPGPTDGAAPGPGAPDAATEEPSCTVVAPDGDEVTVELAANRSTEGGSALARFSADEDGRHEVACEYDGSALAPAVADDGAWAWDREREAYERRGVVLAVVVVAAAVGLGAAGLRLRRR